MSFTVRAAIDGARAWHPAFSEARHGDTVLFDYLMSFQRTERYKLQSLIPEALLDQLVLALPLAVYSEGVAIALADTIFSASAITADGATGVYGDPVALIPMEHLADPGVWPAAAWVGGQVQRLYLKGEETSWSAYTELEVKYVPAAVPLTTLDDTIRLPNSLLDVCIAGLCVFMAMRCGGEGVTPDQVSFFTAMLRDNRSASDMALGSQRAGEVWKIRELT